MKLSYFRPFKAVLDFDGQNRYRQDITAKNVDLVTSISYHDAAEHEDGIFQRILSLITFNRRAR
jgi:hypothetical protein